MENYLDNVGLYKGKFRKLTAVNSFATTQMCLQGHGVEWLFFSVLLLKKLSSCVFE